VVEGLRTNQHSVPSMIYALIEFESRIRSEKRTVASAYIASRPSECQPCQGRQQTGGPPIFSLLSNNTLCGRFEARCLGQLRDALLRRVTRYPLISCGAW